MTKGFGGVTGQANVPTSNYASGCWTCGTEVYYQRVTQNAWPSAPIPPPQSNVGELVFVLASGTRDAVMMSDGYICASGQAISRTTYSGLFDTYGTLYGAGDGATTFNVPNYTFDNTGDNGGYGYFRTTTNSGATLAELSGVGVLPHHTHSVEGVYGTSSWPTSCGSPGSNNRNMNPSASNMSTGTTGSAGGNQLRHRQVYPMLSTKETHYPIGCLIQYLLATNEAAFVNNQNIPTSYVIPSGQAISRTDNATLFNQFGTHFGAGDGSTTFNIPDLRGAFTRGTAIAQTSGALPSGYILDDMAEHEHFAQLYYTNNTNDCNGPGSYNGALGTGAETGTSSVGNTGVDNRIDNITVVYLLNVNNTGEGS